MGDSTFGEQSHLCGAHSQRHGLESCSVLQSGIDGEPAKVRLADACRQVMPGALYRRHAGG